MTRSRDLAMTALFGAAIGGAVFGGVAGALLVLVLAATGWAVWLVFWKAERWQDAYRARLRSPMHQHNGRPCYGEACRPYDYEKEEAA